MLRNVILCFFTFVVAGCSTVASVVPSANEGTVSEVAAVYNLGITQAMLTPGALIKITDQVFSGEVHATVEQRYQSALGEDCYRLKLLDADIVSKLAALCKGQTGNWFVAPPVWPGSDSRKLK